MLALSYIPGLWTHIMHLALVFVHFEHDMLEPESKLHFHENSGRDLKKVTFRPPHYTCQKPYLIYFNLNVVENVMYKQKKKNTKQNVFRLDRILVAEAFKIFKNLRSSI